MHPLHINQPQVQTKEVTLIFAAKYFNDVASPTGQGN